MPSETRAFGSRASGDTDAVKKANPRFALYYKNVVRAEKTGPHEVRFEFDAKGNRELPQIVLLARELGAKDLSFLAADVSNPHAFGRELGYRNTNGLVRSAQWDIGLSKTGYISEAGRCLVMRVRMASREVIVVLLDSWGRLSRVGDAPGVGYYIFAVQAMDEAGAITPVPGGVGPMTIAMLMNNTYRAAEIQDKK